MAWQGLHISQPCRLSLRQGQIRLEREGQAPLAFAPEDVAWILLDTQQVEMTASLLARCVLNGVAVIVSDDKHHPCGMMLPFHQHHKQAEIAAAQLATSLPVKKKLWQTLVRQKIRNQSAHLSRLDATAGKTLAAMARLVISGDPQNVEARAARFYWQRLYQDFTRADAEDRRNALMNYGYAIIRAALARAIAAAGLLPCFGIHHESISNAFNLADDLIEPFRPFVDVMASNRARAEPDPAELTREDRQHMAFILSAEATVNGEVITLLNASERIAFSLAMLMQGKGDALALPEFRETG